MKKQKKTANKKSVTKKAEKVSITDMSIFGKKIHPVIGTIGGIAITPLGGVFTIFGAIFAVTGVIALVHHHLKSSKK